MIIARQAAFCSIAASPHITSLRMTKPVPDSYERDQAILVSAGLVVTTLLTIGAGLLLVWFALLRENGEFWTNAGGYPIWLRDLVLWTYWPLLLGTIGLLFALSAACFAKLGCGLRFMVLESMLLLLGWGEVAASGCISFENNVQNILHGSPIHSHQQVR